MNDGASFETFNSFAEQTKRWQNDDLETGSEDTHVSNSGEHARWFILVPSCIVMLGLYYIIHLPAPIRDNLKSEMPTDNFELKFNLFFAFSSAPAIFLPPFIGAMVDTFGGRTCLVCLSSTCLLGQIISSLGVTYSHWSIALLGRFVLGLGLEPLFVANTAFLSKWFADGREIGFALGMASVSSYIGCIVSFLLGPILANAWNVPWVFWMGCAFQGGSVLGDLVVYVIDKREDCRKRHESCAETEQISGVFRQESTTTKAKKSILREGQNRGESSQKNINCGAIFKSLLNLGAVYWLLCILCVLNYSIVKSFANVSSGILLEKYFQNNDEATEKAGLFMSVPYFVTILMAPIFGHVIDKTGKRGELMIVSSFLLSMAHLALAFMENYPVIPLITQGIGYSLTVAVVWPSVSFAVDREWVGLGIGVMTSIQGIGLAGLPLVIAFVYKEGGDRYIPGVEIFFAALAVLACFVGLWMVIVDGKRGGQLNRIEGFGRERVNDVTTQ